MFSRYSVVMIALTRPNAIPSREVRERINQFRKFLRKTQGMNISNDFLSKKFGVSTVTVCRMLSYLRRDDGMETKVSRRESDLSIPKEDRTIRTFSFPREKVRRHRDNDHHSKKTMDFIESSGPEDTLQQRGLALLQLISKYENPTNIFLADKMGCSTAALGRYLKYLKENQLISVKIELGRVPNGGVCAKRTIEFNKLVPREELISQFGTVGEVSTITEIK